MNKWTLYRCDTIQQHTDDKRLRDLVLLFVACGDTTHVLCVPDYYDNFYFPALPGVDADEFAQRLWQGVLRVAADRKVAQEKMLAAAKAGQ